MTEKERYFDMGVQIGKTVFSEHLKGDSLLASKYTSDHAAISLRKLQIQFGTILPYQDMVKRGIRMGVLTAGTQQRRANHG